MRRISVVATLVAAILLATGTPVAAQEGTKYLRYEHRGVVSYG